MIRPRAAATWAGQTSATRSCTHRRGWAAGGVRPMRPFGRRSAAARSGRGRVRCLRLGCFFESGRDVHLAEEALGRNRHQHVAGRTNHVAPVDVAASAAAIRSASVAAYVVMSRLYSCCTASTTGDDAVTPNGMSRGASSCTALIRHTPKITPAGRPVSATTDFLATEDGTVLRDVVRWRPRRRPVPQAAAWPHLYRSRYRSTSRARTRTRSSRARNSAQAAPGLQWVCTEVRE